MDQQQLLKLPPDLYSRNKTISLILEMLNLPPTTQLLDVGGNGGKLDWFMPEGYKTIVVDKKLKPATAVQTAQSDENYIVGDARNLPFPDNSFEVVVACDLLDHVAQQDRLKVLEELNRVSKNYLILGSPFKKDFLENIENIVAQQFFENAGVRHPFLNEHRALGLPDQKEVETFLQGKGYSMVTIGEGNMVNWALQQLSLAAKQGEKDADRLVQFNEYANERFDELGNYREPTYRTFFCASKQNIVPSIVIQSELAEHNHFNIKTFCYWLKIVFSEDRKLLNRRKKQLNMLADNILETRTKMEKLVTERGELQSALDQLRAQYHEIKSRQQGFQNGIHEKEQQMNFLKADLNEKMAIITNLEEEKQKLSDDLTKTEHQQKTQEQSLEQLDRELSALRGHLIRQDRAIYEKEEQLQQKNNELLDTKLSLNDQKKSLKAILNSRSWKTMMLLKKVGTTVWTRPVKMIGSGFKILFTRGPGALGQETVRKFKGLGDPKSFNNPYELYIDQHRLSPEKQKQYLEEQEKFEYKPLISVIMPVYNIAEEYLVKAIESVLNQIYGKFELCICDDESAAPHIRPLLERYSRQDSRIKVVYRKKQGGIVKASNDALKLAKGAYVALLDSDDELAPEAFHEVVKVLQEKKYDFLYSDEDKIDREGNRCEPSFKPGWSPDLLFSVNYTGHLSVFRRKIVEEVGCFREGYEGAQEYDLTIRVTERVPADSIKHIPKILYHWRKIAGSTAETIDAKPYVLVSAKKALVNALKRCNITGEILDGIWHGSFRLKRQIQNRPLVSIIIPFKDKKDLLENCLRSISQKTTYQNYEIILVNNQSTLFETLEFMKEVVSRPNTRLLNYLGPFNKAALYNFAVKEAKGEVLVLLNNDTEVITPGWIESMLEHIERPEVGAVGAKLLYPNNTLRHAGVLVGVAGIANPAFNHQSGVDHGYLGQIDVIRNYSAVTSACIMVSKSLYEKMGGLDEQNLGTTFNDVDFCLRLREKGYLIVYTPYACLYHHEKVSTRGNEINLKETEYMQRKYAGLLQKGDPYYNPNLTREKFDFSLRCEDQAK